MVDQRDTQQTPPTGPAGQQPPPAGPPAQPPPPEPEQPEAQVQAELDELMDRLKRVTADYQNYQKRMAREMADARKFANAEFAREVLTVVDDLERAMAAGGSEPAPQNAILDGVRITHEHLMAILARHGVRPIEAKGRPFDPELHEAMMQRPSDQVKPMTVLEELTRGYQMHDRTLRPARVVVAVAPAKEG